MRKFANDKFLKDAKPSVLSIADVLKERSRSFLALPKYKPIVEEYDRTILTGAKNPPWYALFNGPKNIEGLARSVQISLANSITSAKKFHIPLFGTTSSGRLAAS